MKIHLTEKSHSTSSYSVVLILLVTIAILFIRKTDAFTNPQFWAEDGVIFFLQQYNNGAYALFQAYAGYLHLAPRLIALIADTLIPYSSIPVFYNYSSLLITIIVILSIFSSRLQANHKILMALTIPLAPNHANEVFLNITNLQWILSIMLIIVLLKKNPSTRYGNVAGQYIFDLATIIVCGLTGPFIILLVPFFVWKWISQENLYNVVILTVAIIISLIQLSFIASSSINSPEASSNFAFYSAIIGHKMFGGLFLGSGIAYRISHYVLSALYLGMLILLLYIAYQKSNRFIFFSIGISVVYLLSALYRAKLNPETFIPPDSATRYFYIPYIMLTWSLIALVEQREKWKNILLKVGLALILISSLTSGFHSKPFIDYNWTLYSQSIGKEDVVIPINPKGWQINVKAIRSASQIRSD